VARFVRAHPWSFALAVLGAGIFVTAIMASAVVIGRVADVVIIPVLGEGAPVGDRVWWAVGAIMGVAVWKAAGITLRRTAAGYLQYRTRADARRDLVEHQLRLDLSWHGRRTTGDLLSVSEADTQQGTFVLAPLPYATGASLLLVGTVVLVAVTDLLLGAIVLVGLGLVVAIDVAGAFSLFAGFEEVQRERGVVARVAHESIDGALTVKALGREAEETRRFAVAANRLADRLARVESRLATFRSIVEALPVGLTIVVLVVGVLEVASGTISAGRLVAVAYLLTLLALPLQLVGFVVWEMAHSQAAWERVREVLEADEVVAHGTLLAAAGGEGAAVETAAVEFGYTSDERVLADVAFDVPPGRTIAVVGPTGAGKSTLVMLLARLWDPRSGHIRIDERDVRDFARSELATEVAFVGQETFLFDGTVRENVTLGAPVDPEEFARAVRRAGVERFVVDLPEGYDTPIGERGVALSGGQRQRIALARALVRRPRVLVLDDATSAVDPSLEVEILRELRDGASPATLVIVAYRRSAIVLADEVVYLEGGRIVAHGTHEELLAGVPGYERLLRAYEEHGSGRGGPGEGTR